MNFKSELPNGSRLFVSNKEGQTRIALESSGQNQSQSFSTGDWKQNPALFEIDSGLVLKIEGDKHHFFRLQNTSAQQIDAPSELDKARSLKLDETSDEPAEMAPMEPMQGMKPMESMKPMGS